MYVRLKILKFHFFNYFTNRFGLVKLSTQNNCDRNIVPDPHPQPRSRTRFHVQEVLYFPPFLHITDKLIFRYTSIIIIKIAYFRF